MSFAENWRLQREGLQQELASQQELSAALYRVRHALLQTEQNTLSEIHDETLRQQAGVLFGGLKNNLALLEVPMEHQVWQAQNEKKKTSWLWYAAACVQAALMLYGYFAEQWFLLAVSGAALVLGGCAFLHERKTGQPEQKVSVAFQPDSEKLLSVLDAQMTAMDRALQDFSVLNEKNASVGDGSVTGSVQRAAELMEALYDWDEEERSSAEESAKGLLKSMGLQVLDYSGENAGYFNVLPSRSCSRTMAPALLSEKDGHVVHRGTAVVEEKQEAAVR